jgi:hypothetical protein
MNVIRCSEKNNQVGESSDSPNVFLETDSANKSWLFDPTSKLAFFSFQSVESGGLSPCMALSVWMLLMDYCSARTRTHAYLGDCVAHRIADGRHRRFDAVESHQRLPLGLVLGQLERVQGTLCGAREGEGQGEGRERQVRRDGREGRRERGEERGRVVETEDESVKGWVMQREKFERKIEENVIMTKTITVILIAIIDQR